MCPFLDCVVRLLRSLVSREQMDRKVCTLFKASMYVGLPHASRRYVLGPNMSDVTASRQSVEVALLARNLPEPPYSRNTVCLLLPGGTYLREEYPHFFSRASLLAAVLPHLDRGNFPRSAKILVSAAIRARTGYVGGNPTSLARAVGELTVCRRRRVSVLGTTTVTGININSYRAAISGVPCVF